MAILYRHIRLDKNEPFYIGIGKKTSRAYFKHSRNKYWNNVVSNTDYEVEIMLDDLTWEEACEKEKEFIKLYGRKNNGSGILANMTDGGEGTLGRKPWNVGKEGHLRGVYGKEHPRFGLPSEKKGTKLSQEVKIKNRNSQPHRKKIKVIDHKTNIVLSTYDGIAEMITEHFGITKGSKGFNGIQAKVGQMINNKPHRIWNGVKHYRKSYKGFRFELVNE